MVGAHSSILKIGSRVGSQLIGVCLLAASMLGQEIATGEPSLDQPYSLALPATLSPTILELEVQLAPGARIAVRRGGAEIGGISDRDGMPRHRRVHEALPINLEPQTWQLEASLAGCRVLRAAIIPATELSIEIVATETGRRIPGVVRLLALDGHDLPSRFETRKLPGGEAAWLLDSGSGESYVPAGMTASLVAFQSPFREPARQRVRGDAGKRRAVRFALGPDRSPEGSAILEAPAPATWRPVWSEAFDRGLGVARRVEGSQWVQAVEIGGDPDGVGMRWLQPGAGTLQVSSVATGWLSRETRRFCSLRLNDGSDLHSNGPLLLVRPFVRDLRNSLGARVSCEATVFLPPSVSSGRLRVRSSEGELFSKRSVRSGEVIPIELTALPGTRVLVEFEGEPFSRENPTHPLPRAWRTSLLP